MKENTSFLLMVLLLIFIESCSKEDETLDSVSIDKSKTELKVGEEMVMKFTYSPKELQTPEVTWESSNTEIATIDSRGCLKAKKAGTSMVTMTSITNPSLKDKCLITVTDINANSIKLNEKQMEMIGGETFQLEYTIDPPTATKEILWTSDNPQIAMVDSGLVTGIYPGETFIYVRVKNSLLSDKCKVTVLTTDITDIILSETSVKLEMDRTFTLTATVQPDFTTQKEVKWSSSDNSVATVKDGVVKGINIGICSIYATSEDGKIIKECKIEVIPVQVQGITINGNYDNILINDQFSIDYTISPADAANKNVTVTSSDTHIIAVEPDGSLKAVAKGVASITITTEDGQFTTSLQIKINDITELISLRYESHRATIINGVYTGSLYSFILNNSRQDIILTRFEIQDSKTHLPVAFTESPDKLGTLPAGIEINMGSSTLVQVYKPVMIWHFTWNGKQYQVSQNYE